MRVSLANEPFCTGEKILLTFIHHKGKTNALKIILDRGEQTKSFICFVVSAWLNLLTWHLSHCADIFSFFSVCLTLTVLNFWNFTSYWSLKTLMVGHGGSSAGSYLADPTSPIPSHCASIVVTSTLRVNPLGLFNVAGLIGVTIWHLWKHTQQNEWRAITRAKSQGQITIVVLCVQLSICRTSCFP